MTEKTRRRRNGRPPYQPSTEVRVSVERMKFAGESEDSIARSLSIDVDTLRKHFAYELEHGHANRMQEVLGLLFTAASKGSVAAQKHLATLGNTVGAAVAAGQGREPEPAPPKLGKKEARQAAADAVTGAYEVPAGPKLVVSNG